MKNLKKVLLILGFMCYFAVLGNAFVSIDKAFNKVEITKMSN